MKCTNCGKEIDNNSTFCEFCGAKIKFLDKKIGIRWLLITSTLLVSISNIALSIIISNQDHLSNYLFDISNEWIVVFNSILAVISLISVFLTIKKHIYWNDCLTIWLYTIGNILPYCFIRSCFVSEYIINAIIVISIYYILFNVIQYAMRKKVASYVNKINS